eukprot:2053778-Prymnesium_polylepis.1
MLAAVIATLALVPSPLPLAAGASQPVAAARARRPTAADEPPPSRALLGALPSEATPLPEDVTSLVEELACEGADVAMCVGRFVCRAASRSSAGRRTAHGPSPLRTLALDLCAPRPCAPQRLLVCEPLASALASACPRKSWYRGWLTRTTEVRIGDGEDGEERPLTLELEVCERAEKFGSGKSHRPHP